MHFDFLIEDTSGEIMLEFLLDKMLNLTLDTYSIRKYQGVGHLPKGLKGQPNPTSKALLTNLPFLLRGYGKTHAGYSENFPAVIIVIFDLDNNNLSDINIKLSEILNLCDPRPNVRFCIAIEEGEAWLLGDIPAICQAYPDAKMSILNGYINDDICGTWELLADAIHQKGSTELKEKGYPFAGEIKCEWAMQITPHMNLDNNLSPSFNYFYEQIKQLRS